MPEGRPLTISIFAGHSGGHIFPAQAYAEELRRRRPEAVLHLITSRKANLIAFKLPDGLFNRIVYMEEFPHSTGFSLSTLIFLLKLLRAFARTFRYLNEAKPDFCAGFGSYVSYPGIFLAEKMKIPNLIHEQNRIAGKATKMLAMHADIVAVSFGETFANTALKHREVTGLPVRSFLRAPKTAVKDAGKFRVLVVGGSQGAHRLNEVVLESFLRLTPEEKQKIAVIHITGNADFARVSAAYIKAGVENETYPFYEKMQELYQKADLAVTRAGANTVFELALYGLPAILIPYPFAGGHQAANADYFAVRNAALMKEEKELNADWLAGQIREFANNETLRQKFSIQISNVSVPDAAERLADLTEAKVGEFHEAHAR